MKLTSVASRFFKHKATWILCLVLFLFLALFCLRGCVRNSIVPAYVNATYGEKLNKTAERQITPIHAKLTPLGFTFTQWPGYTPGQTCGFAYFHNFKETVLCGVSFHAEFTPTPEQLETLKAQGDSLERWLIDEGWTKESTHYGLPLDEFFDVEYASTNYKKQVDSAACLVTLSWQTSQTSAASPSTLSAFTTCSRKVKFFGGSDTLYDPELF